MWAMSAATGCMKDPSHASGPGTAARSVSHPAHSLQLANQFDFMSGPGKDVWLFHPTTRCLSDQVHPRSITRSITYHSCLTRGTRCILNYAYQVC